MNRAVLCKWLHFLLIISLFTPTSTFLHFRWLVAIRLEFNRSGVWYLIVDDKNCIVKLWLLKLWLSAHYELSQISRISNRWILIFEFAKYREMFVRKNFSICCLRIPLGHLLMRTILHGWTTIYFIWCIRYRRHPRQE